VPAFGTTTPTTLTFTSATATPAFSIAADGFAASGPTTFGSCIFTVSTSTFPASSPLAAGKSVTINPCNLTAATSGGVANGVASDRAVQFVLGALNSLIRNLPVVINPNGSIVINGVRCYVTISVTTGATATGTPDLSNHRRMKTPFLRGFSHIRVRLCS
jgi:hypothetical protein